MRAVATRLSLLRLIAGSGAVRTPNRTLASLLCLMALAGLCFAPGLSAQTARTEVEDYDNAIKGAQSLSRSGPDQFGESVDLKDGATAFDATDIELRTNSGLPLAVKRSLRINTRDAGQYADPASDGELFGNWQLDVPYISGIFDERTGWVSSMPNGQQRCSISGWGAAGPPAVKSAYTSWNTYYLPEEYWSGNNVNIPDVGRYPLLYLPPDRSRPSDGRAYYWTTRGDWRVACVPTLKNGTGEGFLIVLPDGTRYTFDWISSRKSAPLKSSNCVSTALYESLFAQRPSAPVTTQFGRPPLTWESGFNTHYAHAFEGGGGSLGGCALSKQVVVNRREYFLHATKVEDRFGNWIAYQYDPARPRRLTSITSNDGVSVSFQYGANGKIVSATTGDRSWQYQYADAGGRALAAVEQPDGGRWTYQYGDLERMLNPENQRVVWIDCDPVILADATQSVTIGHPAGAKGVFTFKTLLHGTDRTPGSCSVPNPNRPLQVDLSPNLMAYKVASLISKQVSGPGLAPMTWSYQYQPSWSWNPTGYSDDCTWAGASCNATSSTQVVGPDGTVTRSTFGNDYYRSAGQLLRVDVVSNGTVLRSVAHTYMADANGQAYPDRVGWDPNLTNNRFATERLHPLRATSITQDGATFAWEVEACAGAAYCFDGYARPTVVKKHSSLGYSKREEIAYHDNPALWVLGQMRRRADLGTGMLELDIRYNDRALPAEVYSFGALQSSMTYAADGSLAASSDGRGNTTSFENYHRGIPRLTRYPATPEAPSGAVKSVSVDDNGRIASLTDEVGAKTCYGYDAMGRLASITYPSETALGVCDASRWQPVTLALQYVDSEEHGIAAGHWRLARRIGANAHINTYYDGLAQPLLEASMDANDIAGTLKQVVKRYDADGRKTFESYPTRGVVGFADVIEGTRTYYDALSRVTKVEQHSEHGLLTTVTEYLSGLQTRVTNPRGAQISNRYMAWEQPRYDLPVQSLQPEGKVVEISRHAQFGWPLQLKQRSADNTLQASRYYAYDGNARLCKTVEPETGATVMGYDASGNLAWSASGLDATAFGPSYDCQHVAAWNAGRLALRSYDARNRLSRLSFLGDGRGNQVWTYTQDGLPASITAYNEPNDAAPVVTGYTYNNRRLLEGESLTQPGWYTWGVGYHYDARGHMDWQTYPGGVAIDYAPNALGQATKAGPFARGASYHPNGALKQFTYGNGLVYTMTQNARQLPQRIASSAGVLDLGYHFDQNGNVTQMVDGLRGDHYGRWMSYDGLDRLTDAGSCSFGGDCWHRFGYDALDNMKSWKLAGVKDHAEYLYDGRNRLTNVRNSAGASVIGLGYDLHGNLQNKNGQGYEFDSGNRLRAVTGKEYYRYDGLGRRVTSWRPAAPDGADLLMSQYGLKGKLLFQHETGKLDNSYIYLGDQLVATLDSASQAKYRHTDALGSPVATTNQAGAVIERQEYEPYGAIVGQPSPNGLGYTGHHMDGATGLTYMQQRYYDAQLGSFLSVDPIAANATSGDGFNRYRYADGNPYRFVDPDGRQARNAPVVPTPPPPPPPAADEVPILETIHVFAPKPVPARGTVRNPPMGQMSDKQAEWYMRRRVSADFLFTTLPAQAGADCAVRGCVKSVTKAYKAARDVAISGAAGMATVGNIEVPTDAEIDAHYAKPWMERNGVDLLKLEKKLTGIAESVWKAMQE